jgi:hypothetical protein
LVTGDRARQIGRAPPPQCSCSEALPHCFGQVLDQSSGQDKNCRLCQIDQTENLIEFILKPGIPLFLQFLIIFSRGAPVDFGGARRSKFQNSYCVATWVLGGAVVSSGTYMCRTCPPPPTLRRNAGSGGRFVMASSPLLVSMGLRCHDKPAASTNIAVQCGYWRAGAAHVNEFSMSSP